ncbi:hypothetical protein [Arenibacter hampyeongensis]|nr:hypothetical protein [Arenibacter hampyeongensis]
MQFLEGSIQYSVAVNSDRYSVGSIQLAVAVNSDQYSVGSM